LVDIDVFYYILKFVFTRLSVTNSQFPQRGYNSSTSQILCRRQKGGTNRTYKVSKIFISEWISTLYIV